MDRVSTLLRIAAITRSSHRAALQVVGWFAASASHEDLDALLELLEEPPGDRDPLSHLEAARERWGAATDGR